MGYSRLPHANSSMTNSSETIMYKEFSMISGHSTVITESPLTASKIGESLGLPTLSTYGHIFDYQLKNDRVCLVAKNGTAIDRIQWLNNDSQLIYVATDYDPQGELIAQHIKALTPRATHKRVLISSLDKASLKHALSHPTDFNDKLASEGAYLRVMNLRLKASRQSSYLTTTGITIANSFALRGRMNTWENHTIELGGHKLYTKLPRGIDEHNKIHVELVKPCTTRALAIYAALNNIENLHEKLQQLYEQEALSYFRTDSLVLPQKNGCYTTHCSKESLQEPHYAIHNLLPHSTRLERIVYKINESATSTTLNAVNLDFGLGKIMAVDEAISEPALTPQSEIMMHLALAEDSYASIIAKHPKKYCRHFYNGNTLNTGLIRKTLVQARNILPDLLDKGIKQTIKEMVSTDNTFQMNETKAIQNHDFKRIASIELDKSLDICHAI
ncbi:type IA DNA topoisomerase [Vibrio vulnificus]|nr:type IA DNA topoisomerase [Vibrio vulnificus]